MPFSHGKFNKPGSVKSAGEKAPPESKPQDKGAPPPAKQGQQQGSAPQHVTQSHPGETQPHPTTGVHAVHAHHTGGGKYTSHTHHDGGDVETTQHGSAAEMHDHMQQALPDDGQGQQQPPMPPDPMQGIGGHSDNGYGG